MRKNFRKRLAEIAKQSTFVCHNEGQWHDVRNVREVSGRQYGGHLSVYEIDELITVVWFEVTDDTFPALRLNLTMICHIIYKFILRFTLGHYKQKRNTGKMVEVKSSCFYMSLAVVHVNIYNMVKKSVVDLTWACAYSAWAYFNFDIFQTVGWTFPFTPVDSVVIVPFVLTTTVT